MIDEDAQIDAAKQHIEIYVCDCGAQTADDSAAALLLLAQLTISAMDCLIGKDAVQRMVADNPRQFEVTARRPS